MLERAGYWVIGGIGATLIGWWLSLPQLVQILAYLQILDTVAGLLTLTWKQRLNYREVWFSVRKKVYAWILVMTVWVLGMEFTFPVINNYNIVEITAAGFVIAEVVSILENSVKLGIPIPKPIQRVLEQVKTQVGIDEEHPPATGV